MKALLVTPYYAPKIGGLENYARQLGIALKELQHWEIVVVTSNHASKGKVVDTVDGIKVYRLPILFKFSNTPINPLWPLYIRSILKQEKPDIILSHSPVPTMADAVALAAGRTPILLTYHAATLMKGGSLIFNMVARTYRAYERLTFSRAHRILAVSEYVKEQFSPRLQQKTVVVPNGVWAKDIVERTQPSGAHFLFIGSLDKTHSWKGLDQIIDAVALYTQQFGKDCRLTVMGDGNARADYEAQALKLGIQDQVVFIGAQSGDAKNAALSEATALISYPTTANDAFPTVLLEAWARQVPVIASAIGPLPSLVHDGRDGYLVAPHDAAALKDVMYRVASSSVADRSAVAAAASLRTARNYTWEQHAAQVAELTKEVIA
jgi:glycosyltransferase involved in cell wall biosynthesis